MLSQDDLVTDELIAVIPYHCQRVENSYVFARLPAELIALSRSNRLKALLFGLLQSGRAPASVLDGLGGDVLVGLAVVLVGTALVVGLAGVLAGAALVVVVPNFPSSMLKLRKTGPRTACSDWKKLLSPVTNAVPSGVNAVWVRMLADDPDSLAVVVVALAEQSEALEHEVAFHFFPSVKAHVI